MCLHPRTIPNPFYLAPQHRAKSNINAWTKANLTHIQVPCGTCCECLQKAQEDIVQRLREISKDYFLFFNTLTYSDEILTRPDHTAILPLVDKINNSQTKLYHAEGDHLLTNLRNISQYVLPYTPVDVRNLMTEEEYKMIHATGEFIEVHYAPSKDISDLFRRLRKQIGESLVLNSNGKLWNISRYDIKMFYCSEYGSHTHRAHWHGLLCVRKPSDVEVDSLHLQQLENKLDSLVQSNWKTRTGGTNRHPEYTPNSNFIKWNPLTPEIRGNYDFHLVRPMRNKFGKLDDGESIAFYCTKYMLKPDSWYEKILGKMFTNCTLADANYGKKLIHNKRSSSRRVLTESIVSCHYSDPDHPELNSVYSIVEQTVNTRVPLEPGLVRSTRIRKEVYDRVHKMVERTYPTFGYPCYINSDGSTYVLGRYLKQYCCTITDVIENDPHINPETKEWDYNAVPEFFKEKDENTKEFNFQIIKHRISNRRE